MLRTIGHWWQTIAHYHLFIVAALLMIFGPKQTRLGLLLTFATTAFAAVIMVALAAIVTYA